MCKEFLTEFPSGAGRCGAGEQSRPVTLEQEGLMPSRNQGLG